MFDLDYLDYDLLLKNEQLVVGCDEVGRGPLAGPVVGCSMIMRITKADSVDDVKKALQQLEELGICDSKKISAIKRRKILEEMGISVLNLKPRIVYQYSTSPISFSYSLQEISPEEIDQINILQASLKAMKKSFFDAKFSSAHTVHIMVDGNRAFDIPADDPRRIKIDTIVKGDSKSLLIGAASIIAKEYRDNLMAQMDSIYPGYSLANHAGYPTKTHKEAISRLGVTPIHRKSFAGVKEHVK